MYLVALQEILKKTDASVFVKNKYFGTNYIESNIEEDIDMKNQHRNKNIKDLISIREAASNYYVDVFSTNHHY